ncbi:MFS general substrate transporter [Aureobasidium sp. EXF-10728]|nr:MFS general substrate transporter [Aureobasidium sp. EXF-10728]
MSAHELQSFNEVSTQDGQNEEREVSHMHQQQLGPVDGGLVAWRVLLVAFVFEAILWELPKFSGSPYITYIGSIATGIVYLGSPLMAPLVKRYPFYQRYMVWVGWMICLASLVAGSFADSLGSLIITQGVMYGGRFCSTLTKHENIANSSQVGYLIIFYPIVSIVNEWWVTRRGFAWGIMIGASGASGIAYPFINEVLLHKYGYKNTLRIMAVATVILTGPLLPFIKGRLPASHSAALVKTDWSFVRQPLFWLYILSTITQSLGFYLPTLYLPSYASAIGLSSKIGATLVALMSVASVIGQFTYGHLSDGRLSLSILLVSTTLVPAVFTLTLWGFAKSLAPLIVFVFIYGFFAYAYLAMRVRMGSAVAPEQDNAMVMFCTFSFAQGIGNVLAGPISGALLNSTVDTDDYGYTRYKALIIFTGATMVASTMCVGVSCFTPIKYKA